ncbi:hypothetical protein HanRHA438_Chr14g0672261 [Helianthus annuus]|uniref:Uncharacterized protein n=1 Tax=Helianthus annuus TaxID=4232 RepID=A0A251SPH7_HELAN|nr:hypothetical protein HanXRQr2_Chr14g0661141 [Helianthus annuus]KAF5770594.1 hypothetical protein HanXRQr2_Chr14g0661151 [Helianthus annuus]KAJ0465478.1 hypothetical protein HanHA300_Chr14g0538651 [Helianthus annuus]KAJ0487075.1 hypothetical protein HanHA89_Chr14g0586461 [Helianthus annuus]KAJ0661199.1 hypothetical protein HanOQP8_Chr14g0545951 [Helianthus annuus]
MYSKWIWMNYLFRFITLIYSIRCHYYIKHIFATKKNNKRECEGHMRPKVIHSQEPADQNPTLILHFNKTLMTPIFHQPFSTYPTFPSQISLTFSKPHTHPFPPNS